MEGERGTGDAAIRATACSRRASEPEHHRRLPHAVRRNRRPIGLGTRGCAWFVMTWTGTPAPTEVELTFTALGPASASTRTFATVWTARGDHWGADHRPDQPPEMGREQWKQPELFGSEVVVRTQCSPTAPPNDRQPARRWSSNRPLTRGC